jgi:hypothetical protein
MILARWPNVGTSAMMESRMNTPKYAVHAPKRVEQTEKMRGFGWPLSIRGGRVVQQTSKQEEEESSESIDSSFCCCLLLLLFVCAVSAYEPNRLCSAHLHRTTSSKATNKAVTQRGRRKMGNSNLVNETKRVVGGLGALTLRHQTQIEQKFSFKEICLERRKRGVAVRKRHLTCDHTLFFAHDHTDHAIIEPILNTLFVLNINGGC